MAFLRYINFTLHTTQFVVKILARVGGKLFSTLFSAMGSSIFLNLSVPKGQLISKCPFGRKTSSKIPTELFLDFCPEFFVASGGLPGNFLGPSVDKNAEL